MSAEEQRAKIIRYWWSKAEESLASAQRELEAEAYSFAVKRTSPFNFIAYTEVRDRGYLKDGLIIKSIGEFLFR